MLIGGTPRMKGVQMQIVIELPEENCNKLINQIISDCSFMVSMITKLPKHGDLIDRDELLKDDIGKNLGFREIDIRNAPTILEATKEK